MTERGRGRGIGQRGGACTYTRASGLVCTRGRKVAHRHDVFGGSEASGEDRAMFVAQRGRRAAIRNSDPFYRCLLAADSRLFLRPSRFFAEALYCFPRDCFKVKVEFFSILHSEGMLLKIFLPLSFGFQYEGGKYPMTSSLSAKRSFDRGSKSPMQFHKYLHPRAIMIRQALAAQLNDSRTSHVNGGIRANFFSQPFFSLADNAQCAAAPSPPT